jgi:3-oxoacyl-[acyl-carrier-protein] synthase II
VLQEIFGAVVASRVPSADLIGDTSAATAVFQVVALLSVTAADRPPAGSYAIVSAVGADESVACALFKLNVDRCGGHRG